MQMDLNDIIRNLPEKPARDYDGLTVSQGHYDRLQDPDISQQRHGYYLASMNPKQPETPDYPSHPECEAPGHTDLMVSPESIDKFLEDNPPPENA